MAPLAVLVSYLLGLSGEIRGAWGSTIFVCCCGGTFVCLAVISRAGFGRSPGVGGCRFFVWCELLWCYFEPSPMYQLFKSISMFLMIESVVGPSRSRLLCIRSSLSGRLRASVATNLSERKAKTVAFVGASFLLSCGNQARRPWTFTTAA